MHAGRGESAGRSRVWPDLLAALPAGALLVFALGYTNFGLFAQVTLAAVTFVTRAKSNLAYEVLRTLRRTNQVHDAIVWIGRGSERQQVRLISLLYQGTRQRNLTNALDPRRLPPEYAVALSRAATTWSNACWVWPTSGSVPPTASSCSSGRPGCSTPSWSS